MSETEEVKPAPAKGSPASAKTPVDLYKTIREKLEARFPDEVHKAFEDLTYLDPMQYRERLNEVFSEGYKFAVKKTDLTLEGIYGSAYFYACIGNLTWEREILFAEPWLFRAVKDAEGKSVYVPIAEREKIKIDQKFQMANSAGLKAIGRELGIGLYLYDKSDPIHKIAIENSAKDKASKTYGGNNYQQSKTSSNASAKPAGASGGSKPIGTSDEDIWTVGQKHSGKKIADIEDSYFVYMGREDATGPASDAARAILERRANQIANTSMSSVTEGDDAEEKFDDKVLF